VVDWTCHQKKKGVREVSELEVRIVQMEPMRVAVAHGYGESPELIAADKMLAFLASKGLKFEDVRWFGFNNPNPSPGSPNYGYDVWATVGPDVEGEGDVVIKEVPARRYAVTRFKDLSNIGQVWKQLVLWFEDSAYKKPSYWHECLENLLVHPDTPYEEYVFDLYLPIAG
jgi:effector-binding domain-containing protein